LSEETRILFPCDYPIKVLCKNRKGIVDDIKDCIGKHDSNINELSMTQKVSGKGNYISLTVVLYALSEKHVMGIYLDLKNIESVKLVL
tara:strand:+ start:652 stop:915 length:264 start_codon:yes stop_codon:yes gene_type:complete